MHQTPKTRADINLFGEIPKKINFWDISNKSLVKQVAYASLAERRKPASNLLATTFSGKQHDSEGCHKIKSEMPIIPALITRHSVKTTSLETSPSVVYAILHFTKI